MKNKPLSKRPKNAFQERLLLNAGQKYCRMLRWEHSAILSTFIKLPVVIETFVLSIFEWPFYTGFTVSLKFWTRPFVQNCVIKIGFSVAAQIQYHQPRMLTFIQAMSMYKLVGDIS